MSIGEEEGEGRGVRGAFNGGGGEGDRRYVHSPRGGQGMSKVRDKVLSGCRT